MAFSPDWASGFEMGSIEIIPVSLRVRAYIETTQVKTGVYSCHLQSGSSSQEAHINWLHGGIYLDFAAWIRPPTSGPSAFNITCYSETGNPLAEIRRFNSTTWDAYVNRVKVATGTVSTENNEWTHVQVRFYIADVGGYIQTRINGQDDIDYSGDTLSSGSYIWLFRLEQRGATTAGYEAYIDDINIGTGGFPGDVRFDGIYPDGDVTTEWTPSTPGTHYTLVDEQPPSDSDYVSGGCSPAVTDQYTMSEWNGASKTAQYVVAWVRAKKDNAGTIKLDIGLDSNGMEDMSGGQDINTSYEYRYHIVELDPDGSVPWDEDAIDALEVIVRTA
jgi:hypothetical protein